MQKQAWRKMKKTAFILSAAMFVTYAGGAYTPEAEAATKAPTLSATNVSLKKGQTKKITIKTSKKEKIKKTTWKVNNKKLKIVKKTKNSLVVKALKTGKITISVKIKTNKKTYNKKVKVSVPVKKSTPKPKKTADVTKEPVKTEAPGSTTQKPDVPDKPSLTDVPNITETPLDTEPPKDTEKPSETKEPVKTSAPSANPLPDIPEIPEELIEGTLAAKTSWNDGVLSNISGIYSGKKLRFTVKVREKGINNPTGKMKITCNYNGSYPTLAEFDISTEWQTITFEHRFNEFTNQYACLYFDDGRGDTPSDLNMYFRDLTIDVLDQGDELGGTSLSQASWHKGSLASLRNSSINGAAPNKAYENKSVHIHFQVRAKGEIPDGASCYIKANGISPNRVIEDIPLTAAWHTVDADCDFGKVTDDWPGLFFDGTDITSDMELFIKDVSLEITGEVAPTPAPSVVPAEGDLNVPLTAAGVYASGCLENEDGSSCNPTYDADGSVTYTASNQYSGGGMAFYLKGDKSAVDLSGYSGVKLVVEGTADRQIVLSSFNSAEPTNGIFTSTVAGTAKYVSLTGSEQEISLDFETETAWGGISDAYAIFVKYNAHNQGDYDGGDKLYATIKIKSITFIAKETTPAPGGDINVPLAAAGVYASGCLENEDGSSCNPTYDADGSVTYTASNQYSGGGMAFYLKGDKSAVDLSGYSGVKLVVEGTADRQIVLSSFNSAEPTNGIFTSTVAGTAKYVSLTGSEQEISLDFETETAWGGISDAYAIFVKYNAHNQGDYDGGDKLYATIKIKSITFIKK